MVRGRSLTLSWLKPEIVAGNNVDHYLVSWGTNRSGTLHQEKVESSNFSRHFGKYVHYLKQTEITISMHTYAISKQISISCAMINV